MSHNFRNKSPATHTHTSQSPNRGSKIYMDVPNYGKKNHAKTASISPPRRSQSPNKGSNIYMNVPNYDQKSSTSFPERHATRHHIQSPNPPYNMIVEASDHSHHIYTRNTKHPPRHSRSTSPRKAADIYKDVSDYRHPRQRPSKSARYTDKGPLSQYTKVKSVGKSPSRSHHRPSPSPHGTDTSHRQSHMGPLHASVHNFRPNDLDNPYYMLPTSLAHDIRHSHETMRLSNAAMDRVLGKSRIVTAKLKNRKSKVGQSVAIAAGLPKPSTEPDVTHVASHLQPNIYGYGTALVTYFCYVIRPFVWFMIV